MKRLILIITLITLTTSCSRDEERNFSAIENFIGQWELQSRILNDIDPQSVEEAKFIFRDDNDIRDFKGLFTLESSEVTNGSFIITNQGNVMEFENSNGLMFAYEFILNTITLELAYVNENDDIVKEVWTKTSNFID